MFERWKQWNKWERLYCILIFVIVLILMPLSFVFIFLIPTPRTHFGIWLFRFSIVMIPVLMALADWRTARKRSYFEFGIAALFLMMYILFAVF